MNLKVHLSYCLLIILTQRLMISLWTFLHMQRYDEAVQHIFDALVLQDSDRVASDTYPQDAAGGVDDGGRGITSNALWNSLKTTVLQMGRMDLAGACDLKDLEGTFDLLSSHRCCLRTLMCLSLHGSYRIPEDTGWSGMIDELYFSNNRAQCFCCTSHTLY